MKRRKNCSVFCHLHEQIRRKNSRRYFITSIELKKKNNFKIWKYENNNYKANIFFHENFQIFKEKDYLLKTRISNFKKINKCNINYLFIFLQFDEICTDHFFNNTLPTNGIHIQILSKLNYLLLLKRVIRNDTSLNRSLKYIYHNYVLAREGRNGNDVISSCIDHRLCVPGVDKNKNRSITIHRKDDAPSSSCCINDAAIAPARGSSGNSSSGSGNIKKEDGKEFFCLKKASELFKVDNCKIVIHTNINNKYIKHVYLEELDEDISTQLNYVYMFDNKIADKYILLQLYSFYEYYKEEVEKKKNEFLFFLDRLCERMLDKMNLIDLVFIFHTHIKQNYYNHLFLFILMNKSEYFLNTTAQLKKEEKKQQIIKKKYNQKSLITFFHSLTNYFFYLSKHDTDGRYRDKLNYVKWLIYNKMYGYLLQYLQENYTLFTALDMTILYSSFFKLGIKNYQLQGVLLDYIVCRSVDGVASTNRGDDKARTNASDDVASTDRGDGVADIQSSTGGCHDRMSGGNMQIFCSFVNMFCKFFTQFSYSKEKYTKVIKSLLVIFENNLKIIVELFFNNACPTEVDDKRRTSTESFLNIVTNKDVNYFAFINLLRISRRSENGTSLLVGSKEKKWSKGVNQFSSSNCTDGKDSNICKDNSGENLYNLSTINENIKYIVNVLNSTYKILNHTIMSYRINEFSKNFHKIQLYNFVDKMIFGHTCTDNYNCTEYTQMLRRYIYNISLFTYSEGININRLFICSYIGNLFLCDFVNVYIKSISQQLLNSGERISTIKEKLNDDFFFSQIVTNTLGAINNLNIRRNGIFENISYLIKKNTFHLQFMHIANIIHSFASVKIRNEKLLCFLLHELMLQMNVERNKKQLNDQILSNISISLLKLDFPNEKFDHIIFANFKKVQSLQSLINITFYISYYNLVYPFLRENYFNYFFQHVKIYKMDHLTVQSKAQLKLISFLILHIHRYCSVKSGISDISFDAFVNSLNNLIRSSSNHSYTKLSNVGLYNHTLKKVYNYVTYIVRKRNALNNYCRINQKFFKNQNNSLSEHTKALNSNQPYNVFLKKHRTKQLCISNCKRGMHSHSTAPHGRPCGKFCSHIYNSEHRREHRSMHSRLHGRLRIRLHGRLHDRLHGRLHDRLHSSVEQNIEGKNTNTCFSLTHLKSTSINMFDIFTYKLLKNKNDKNVKLLDRENYLNLNFVSAFPFPEKPINYSTSNLHNDIFDVIVSLNIKRTAVKEISHYPYYVDIVLL
ncbi:conserved Plasmodium protein, unknown function [Plasmodium malariae]|uniref:Uncharacterized protein n=1 Tax=Plasmodium malariae TaxID=5858 RepID=A0A1A8WEJ1_PLAMA|nr:conserved Plasmodium protein, unknown function [Plasmodium malariae]